MPISVKHLYKNRFEAARKLLPPLSKFKQNKDIVILAIPRGGLQIGAFLAKRLGFLLDVLLVKKLTLPDAPELAIGAVALDGSQIIEFEMLKEFNINIMDVEEQTNKLLKTLKEKDLFYHKKRAKIDLKGKTVIIVDDGIATGNTYLASIKMLRNCRVNKIVVASPISSLAAKKIIAPKVDEFIVNKIDPLLFAVGSYYLNFPQISDEQALKYLEQNQND